MQRRAGPSTSKDAPRIDSPQNPRVVSAVRALTRGERMPIEGSRTLDEALDAAVVPEIVFYVEDEADARLLARAAGQGSRLVRVGRRVLAKLSDLRSARGLVALAIPPSRSVGALPLSGEGIALLLDGVQDPTNVGAIVRSAEALGAQSVLLTGACASPFTARALRASAGSAFRMPIAVSPTVRGALDFVSERGAVLAGAEAHGGGPPEALATIRPLVIAIGSEGRGLSPEIAAAGRHVSIPLEGRAESLNAAVAAALLLFIARAGQPPCATMPGTVAGPPSGPPTRKRGTTR